MTGNQQLFIACLLGPLSLQTAYADALDLIPDAILEDTKTSSEQGGQRSNRRTADGIADRWQIRLRSQLQASSSPDGETTHSVYANVTAAGEHPLGKGRGLADVTLRTRYTHDVAYHVRDDNQLDIKELYYSYPLGHSTHLDLGRINARYGVAFGYNPTDFFKSGVAVDETDLDARSRRNNRLGSVGVRVDHSFAQQSLGLFLSPQIDVSADDPLSDARFSGMNLPRSNPQNRLILSLSSSADTGWFTRLSYIYRDTSSAIGLSSSVVVTNKWLAYAEFALSDRRNLFSEYVAESGPGNALVNIITSQLDTERQRLRLQSSVGLSYTSDTDISTHLEYHHSELAANSAQQALWHSLLDERPELAPQLWELRRFYTDREEPFVADSLWLRSTWNEPLDRWSPSVLGIFSLDDDSGMVQAALTFDASDHIDLEFRATHFFGDTRSFYGSVPNDTHYMVQLEWYL